MGFKAAQIICYFFWPLASIPLAQGVECKPGCHPVNGYCEVSSECRCQPGWQGPLCDQCIPFPGCLHGTCAKPWQCMCEEGWIGSLCDTDVHPCSSKPCTNNSTTCIETGDGGYICLCAQGYTGENCHVKKGPCIVNGAGATTEKALCLVPCNFTSRNRGTTRRPSELDLSVQAERWEWRRSFSSPCQNGGTCVDNGGFAPHASCLCLPGFTGIFCEIDTDDCESNPCENGGTCTDIGRGFRCICPSGYGGVLCSSPITICTSGPCKNGGTCHQRPGGSFECICKPPFAGVTCASSSRNASVGAEAKHRLNHHPRPKAHHKPIRPQEPDVLTIKETVENRQRLLSKSQVICFLALGLLTCLVVLGTTGVIFFSRFEMWLANARYSHLVHKERDCFLKANEGENLSVNIIFPEKIKLTNE